MILILAGLSVLYVFWLVILRPYLQKRRFLKTVNALARHLLVEGLKEHGLLDMIIEAHEGETNGPGTGKST